MTVNIEALICSLEKPWQAIRDAGIITYKTPPQGTQCDPYLTLEMKKEGLFLTFDNDANKSLSEIVLKLKTEKKDWVFPNELPSPLQQNMSRRWVHETFGDPDKSNPPKVVLKMEIGWIERFTVEDFHIPLTMCVYYDMGEMVEAVTFLPTSRLRW
ncbi:pyocin immunity protein [Brenneria goodwinii]|uniref:Pyocin immunity protein n=1 Tax=Brenneria goodwinii TaxID=1109412 RepID=A0A0G4JSR7_9GAMM|nr:DUF6392 family protein [Brenneria goodwinii]ATA25842.1 pyocin immunity protein [Brenneria goodwinii]MCG8155920.1 pyocin immunity protein [Brenneria goodwinii]MCG8162313.1 pyocin immunity protein [Brenneria goodwinii]MCG8166966.1 pyocin immunity protein [Brenneria goodwinii]MCG8169640.1 pyocin immunity protein [Brenneria goodwinii]